ncbi:unnamed protein product [Thlaspi arvense]|uniref:Mitochondrial transcription termination factor family protein n=1 Tax=Thlaspi arvense TaxID=13288 RepID=A0AAU9RRF2_THLAR|nr:unnamed protein product [Thlaspi arvense]
MASFSSASGAADLSLRDGGKDVWAMFKKWPSFLNLSEKKVLNSMETLEGLGFSRDEFAIMVKRFPQCVELTAETVKKKTDFLVKQMIWPLKALVTYPHVLGYSMEERIVPRCNVIKALMSKGLLGERGSKLPSMSSVLSRTDETFLKRYVLKHDDKELVAELMAIFNRDRVKAGMNLIQYTEISCRAKSNRHMGSVKIQQSLFVCSLDGNVSVNLLTQNKLLVRKQFEPRFVDHTSRYTHKATTMQQRQDYVE